MNTLDLIGSPALIGQGASSDREEDWRLLKLLAEYIRNIVSQLFD
jgi:hypothetical protein